MRIRRAARGNNERSRKFWITAASAKAPNFPRPFSGVVVSILYAASPGLVGPEQAQEKRPNIVMLMTDDTGWNDFGAYSGGGAGLGHPTPNIDQMAKEGAVFTNWYGQASCTAGRASFITGRIPIRSRALNCRRPGRREPPPKGNADDRRILPEEWLHDVFLRQVASGRQAGRLSDRTWLR